MLYSTLNRLFRLNVVTGLSKLPGHATIIRRGFSSSPTKPPPIVGGIFLRQVPCLLATQDKDNAVLPVSAEATPGAGEVICRTFAP